MFYRLFAVTGLYLVSTAAGEPVPSCTGADYERIFFEGDNVYQSYALECVIQSNHTLSSADVANCFSKYNLPKLGDDCNTCLSARMNKKFECENICKNDFGGEACSTCYGDVERCFVPFEWLGTTIGKPIIGSGFPPADPTTPPRTSFALPQVPSGVSNVTDMCTSSEKESVVSINLANFTYITSCGTMVASYQHDLTVTDMKNCFSGYNFDIPSDTCLNCLAYDINYMVDCQQVCNQNGERVVSAECDTCLASTNGYTFSQCMGSYSFASTKASVTSPSFTIAAIIFAATIFLV